MKRSFWFRTFLCLLVFGVVLLNLHPVRDIPFEQFLSNQANVRVGEFQDILVQARKQVSSGTAPSTLVALKQISESERIDLTQFFVGIPIVDVHDLGEKNKILLNHLFEKSRAKLKQGLDLKGGVAFTLQAEKSLNIDGSQQAKNLQKAIEILHHRLDSLGVAEPIIRARGDDQIEIQLAGLNTVENPDVIDVIKKPAKLEFRLVHPDPTCTPESLTPAKYPIGYVAMNLAGKSSGSANRSQGIFVKRLPEMTGKAIKTAAATMNNYGGYEVMLQMTPEGIQQFAALTRTHIGKALAIVLDGKLYSAPVIRTEITNGSASISGQFTQREALELANVLNNPLDIELKLTEVYEVGPSLAQDAKARSISAALIGTGLVIVFMIGYYFMSGAVAVGSVIFNIIIVLGMLAAIGSTLTLPGIAALALTVGMGVDANILIFERLREELSKSQSLSTAIELAHTRAFSTIIDANLTTLLTAGILIWLGNGPIKGFGVTLFIGIAASMFCVLVFSKLFLELIAKYNVRTSYLLPFNGFKTSHFKFMRQGKRFFILSWLIILLGMLVISFRSNTIYALDFTGGDEITLQSSEKLSTHGLQALAKEYNLGTIIPVSRTTAVSQTSVLKIQTQPNKGRILFERIQAAYPKVQVTLLGETHIGGAVSSTIKMNALLAVGMSLLGILVYVGFRFETGYGIGAVVSTVHDILLTVGIYAMLGGQFSASMIAAVLMIIGFSINDTIVVFDRIREELQANPVQPLHTIIDLAINRTLSRTVLTSLTTFLAALALYIFGSAEIADFALVFIIGILVGTFSSIFVASPIVSWWYKGDRKRIEHINAAPTYSWQETQ